jgi:putative membrane protein
VRLSASLQPGLQTLPRTLGGLSVCEVALIGAAFVLALAARWLCATYPAAMPAWAPWEFSWSQFLAVVLALGWYVRGVLLLPVTERPSLWRQASFLLGLVAIYAVLLTHFLYMAQHMFFLNRAQHLMMHHLGPFLIALAWPGAALLRGMPAPLRRLLLSAPVRRVLRVVQFPLIAGVLFVGLIYFWLIPAVHFRAMIDPTLYDVMNWSMVVDGLLFWSLVLDPRPSPPAFIGYAMRLIVTTLVMFPQIILGAGITFSTTSLYPYYDLCGRLFPSIGALADQHIGGVILWIPSSMMSSIAFMLTLNNIRRHEDRMATIETDPDVRRMAAMAARWTGR